ncbi:MAG: DUF1566 domain-containing protein [Myxococcales bacterium]|nr:DUF1566 domain-containing protein [Myxococcales bacterium]
MARSRLVFTLGVLAALGAGACGNLIGLDKFVDCTEFSDLCTDGGAGDVDTPDGVGPDVVQPDGGHDADADADADAGPPLPDGSVGSDWAKYRVPNYDGGRVDAAAVANPTYVSAGTVGAAFVDGGSFDGGVAVSLQWSTSAASETTSTWLRTPDDEVVQTFDKAQSHCVKLGGRVPTRIELLMLLDSTQRDTDGSAFMLRPEVRPSDGLVAGHPTAYWTSTALRGDGGIDFWVVDFKSGAVRLTRSEFLGVLCIR